MKNKIILAFIVTLLAYSFASAQSIYQGTWEYQSGNEIFRVILWDVSDNPAEVKGHYEKVTVSSNGEELFVYCSDKERFQATNTAWLPYVISLKEANSKLSGTINDNTVDSSQYKPIKLGKLNMEIVTNTGGTNPTITMSWKVTRTPGVMFDESPTYSFPTDIILTKQN